ncbi:uncharacterized protein LOC119101096 isoform X2 [Pollicipes pollicipes]|uniref:uncharacterized protein LOC119099955 isoform X2 n=1 Tax=Pollicipes pollicipes TaxID=41117 RepID=UPI0018850DE5|nr:uncharacterized protein LOC119099955 isoform X2 [Pollicipes pollicipes]XP_037080259.1 uncharacterized protein LOC119101096 isoform X2 [Pollicipes pollicipes]
MTKNRSLAGKWAVGLLALTFVLVVLAFSTQNWLASDDRFYGAKLEKMGLWVHCFRSLPDPQDSSLRQFFSGCRWLFEAYTTGYSEIRGHLTPPFFIAVQMFYTLCFLCTAVSAVLVVMLILCIDEDREVCFLRTMAVLMALSGVFGTFAVIIFGAMGRSYEWTTDKQHNYLSWSYGLAVVAAFLQLVLCVLVWNEAQITNKKIARSVNAAAAAGDY